MTDIGIETPTRLAGVVPQQRRFDRAIDAPPPSMAEVATDTPISVVAAPVARVASRRAEVLTLLGSDCVAGATAGVAGWELGLAGVLVAALATFSTGLSRRRFSLSVLDDAPRLTRAWVWSAAPLLLLGGLVGASATSLASAVISFGLAFFVLRAVAYRRIRGLRTQGVITFPTLVVGASAEDLCRRITEHPETGLRLVGTSDEAGTVDLGGGATDRITTVMERFRVSDVVLTPAAGADSGISGLVRELARGELGVHVVLPRVGATPVRGWDDHIWGLPLLRMRSCPQGGPTRLAKRITDMTIAAASLLVLSPLLAVVAFLVRNEVGPGVIFRQERVGLNGRTFEVLKFRSIRPLPAAQNLWTVDSHRIGPVGRFIRKYSLDELPQLWNVLRGDMSLVGPRPERPHYVSEFCATYADYAHRHRVPVGLTGLAAVEGLRGNTSIADRVHFDNLYVDSWSYWTDLKIIARTVLSVVRGTGS